MSNQGEKPCGQRDDEALAEHLRGGVGEDEVPDRVAALREALDAAPPWDRSAPRPVQYHPDDEPVEPEPPGPEVEPVTLEPEW